MCFADVGGRTEHLLKCSEWVVIIEQSIGKVFVILLINNGVVACESWCGILYR